MSNGEGACIYCHKSLDLQRGQGDHVIPAALGRFEGEFIFRRICPACNRLIGACEEQLLRCAPEAFVRRIVQPAVKRDRRGKNWVGSRGMPPPKFTVDHGDHHEEVDGSIDDPRNVRAIDQLVVIDKDGHEHHIRLFPKLTASQLLMKMATLGVTPSDRSYLHADEATWPSYVALLREILPGSSVIETEGREAGVHRVKGRTVFRFHNDYWRAIAKIAFHYYLLNSRRGLRGDEPEFATLRRFIVEGGDRELFFTGPSVRFVVPFRELPDGSAILPHAWTHFLAADESNQSAVAMVSLFMGPERLAPVFHVNLARFRSPIILPGARWTHSYVYDTPPRHDGIAGRVVAATLSDLRQY